MAIVHRKAAQAQPKSTENAETVGGNGAAPAAPDVGQGQSPTAGPPTGGGAKARKPATPDHDTIKERVAAVVASGDLDALHADDGLLDDLTAIFHTPAFYDLIAPLKGVAGFDRQAFKTLIRSRKGGEAPGGEGRLLDEKLAKRPLTDLGNAERLVARHGRDLRFCHPWGKWLVWDGRRWKIDDNGEARRRARDTVRAILAEAHTIRDKGRRQEHAEWSFKSEKREKIAAMLYLAEAQEGVPILPDQMDTYPWSFNCRNGTIDLRTGRLRPHRRDDLITKLCPVAYRPDALCPLWLATLGKFFRRDDPGRGGALVGYWQRLCGYSMPGVIRDQVMPVAYGTGSNGKSTILGTMIDVFGPDYAMKCPPDMLMAKKNDAHPTERADLFGKRLVVAIETESGRRLNETMIKELTGGDAIRARRMREDSWEFMPTHTLFMATNHKPVIHGTDHGIWRRLRLVPFTVAVADGDADKAMPEKLRAERGGILAWFVQGCLAWQKEGLDEPAEVNEATEGYRAEQDVIGLFLDDTTDRGPGLKVKAGDLYQRYRRWAETGHEYVLNVRTFGEAIRERGIATKNSDGVWYLGIGLRPDDAVNELARFLETRTEAGQWSVRESIEAAGESGLLGRKSDGSWDAGALWEAARRIGYEAGESDGFHSITGGGKVWVRVDGKGGGGAGP